MDERCVKIGILLEEQLLKLKKHLNNGEKLYFKVNNSERNIEEVGLYLYLPNKTFNKDIFFKHTKGCLAFEEMLLKLQNVDELLKELHSMEARVRKYMANDELANHKITKNILYRTFDLKKELR